MFAKNSCLQIDDDFVHVQQHVRGGGCECNQIPCIAQVTLKLISYTLLVNSGWLYFSNFKIVIEFLADEYELNGGLDF